MSISFCLTMARRLSSAIVGLTAEEEEEEEEKEEKEEEELFFLGGDMPGGT